MPGRIRKGFLGSRNCFFCRLFNLHILQLAITLEDMEDFRVRKHLEYGHGFFPPFPVSASQNLEPFLRPTGLQYCQCWRHLPFSAASLHHFVIKNSKIPLEGDCVSLGLSSYSGGSLLGLRSCHVSVFFWKL